MNVLIQVKEASSDHEIREFTEDRDNRVYISHSSEESIQFLSERPFEKAVISVKSLRDIAILKYLNEYYPSIEVVVITNKAFDDIITVFQKVNYSVIHEPLRLSELKSQIVNSKTS